MLRSLRLAIPLVALCALALVTPHARAQQQAGAEAKAAEAKPADIKPADSKTAEAPASDAPAGRRVGGQAASAATARDGVLSMLPPDSITEHSLATASGPLAYTATAGTLDLFGQSGERIAAIYYTAYVAKDAGRDRPLTFAFNGGPGAASAYLHLGLVGPKILDFGPTGHDGAGARLVDNPQSWLAFTDLVLIDPVGTGWSRAAKADDAKNFYGVSADAETMAKVIALYVARNDRGNSPKYLLGESYGGFRAAKTEAKLREQQGIQVSGIVMLSPLIDGTLSVGAGGSNASSLRAALELPSMAAAELERHGAYTPQALADAEHFALTDYLTALTGPPPSEPVARELYARVAALTGLAPEAVARSRGFVRRDYIKQVRERDHKVVSAYDASLATPDPYPEMLDEHGDDPVLSGFTRAYGGAFAAYARSELGFKCDMTYTLLAHLPWQWGRNEQSSMMEANASDELRESFAVSPSFHLLVAHGTSDLVTPYAANKYVIEHLPSSLTEGRLAMKLYRGGHMFYTRSDSRLAFTADARAFYAGDAATTGRN